MKGGGVWCGEMQDNKDLFEMEERDLMKDLRELPR